ncbi:hypothetical protein GOP47_0029600, partial [Adiantum capillus-veneris]
TAFSCTKRRVSSNTWMMKSLSLSLSLSFFGLKHALYIYLAAFKKRHNLALDLLSTHKSLQKEHKLRNEHTKERHKDDIIYKSSLRTYNRGTYIHSCNFIQA